MKLDRKALLASLLITGLIVGFVVYLGVTYSRVRLPQYEVTPWSGSYTPTALPFLEVDILEWVTPESN